MMLLFMGGLHLLQGTDTARGPTRVRLASWGAQSEDREAPGIEPRNFAIGTCR